jgi:putative ATP-binding cassette transporter
MLTYDIQNIASLFLHLPRLCINLAITVGCIAYLAWLSFTLFVVFQLILLLAITSYLIPEKTAKKYLQKGREEWDSIASYYQALSGGAKELKLHRPRRQAYFDELLAPAYKRFQKYNFTGGIIYQILGGWNQMLYFFVVGLILFGLPVWAGSIPLSVMTGYALTIMYLRGPLTGLIGAIPSWRLATVSLQRLEDLGISLSGEENRRSVKAVPCIAPGIWHISLIGVTHSYHHEDKNANFTLGPIDLDLHPGEALFVIGGNGSGKTTLAKVLTGLYEPEAGEIRVNGELINSHNRDEYRQCFSAIFTDFFLFEKLLGLYHPRLDELAEGYLSDLKLANLVKVVDGRFSTTTLSYGQRKRLALLSAFLEDRLIYVFDEWAAGQDPAFKEIFYHRIILDLKARGKAVIVVSHDDRYFHVADSIIKLEDGKLLKKEAV